MKYFYVLIILLFFSCGKEKSLQLPEIYHSNIHEVLNISQAYVFYNESEKDSVELNRKNLNITTNWLVNVDKRLTLRQAIPSIQILQNKKRDVKSHKNEVTKNYYSCNDTSIKKLGFLDFTEVIYHNGIDRNIVENHDIYELPVFDKSNYIMSILFKSNDSVSINSSNVKKSEFVQRLKYMDSIQDKMMGMIYLKFNQNLTFQDYINYKSLLAEVKLKNAIISNDEYIYN
ncbi:MAG: hypothetical protein ABIO60_03795 [Aquaticitalea sp.]